MAALTVADVYDIAADIGKEFEVVIDKYGADSVVGLMPKVISALEHLERFSSASDDKTDLIESLQTTISHLELEEIKKNEERQRNARELEQIEEHYKQETRDLLATVKRLQDENRRLASSLAAATERDSAFSEAEDTYFEVELVNRLQSVIEKQRSQIKKLDQSVLDVKTENDELKRNNEKLTGCNRDLRRKHRLNQGQLHDMVDERAELLSKLNDNHREINSLTRQLGSAAQERDDMSSHSQSQSHEGDANRPRFNLSELKDILKERNSLKARVSDLEDELAMFRPRDKHLSSVNSPSHGYKVRMASACTQAKCDCSYHARKDKDRSAESDEAGVAHVASEAVPDDELGDDEDDLPVQGPLPEDPDDAPFRKRESGIRKLFKRVFKSQLSSQNSVSTPALDRIGDGGGANSQSLKKSLTRLSFLLSSQDDEC